MIDLTNPDVQVVILVVVVVLSLLRMLSLWVDLHEERNKVLPWAWRRQPPRPRAMGGHEPTPMPGLAPLLKDLDAAALALSTYVWNASDLQRQLDVAELHIGRVRRQLKGGPRPPPPPPAPPPARVVRDGWL